MADYEFQSAVIDAAKVSFLKSILGEARISEADLVDPNASGTEYYFRYYLWPTSNRIGQVAIGRFDHIVPVYNDQDDFVVYNPMYIENLTEGLQTNLKQDGKSSGEYKGYNIMNNETNNEDLLRVASEIYSDDTNSLKVAGVAGVGSSAGEVTDLGGWSCDPGWNITENIGFEGDPLAFLGEMKATTIPHDYTPQGASNSWRFDNSGGTQDLQWKQEVQFSYTNVASVKNTSTTNTDINVDITETLKAIPFIGDFMPKVEGKFSWGSKDEVLNSDTESKTYKSTINDTVKAGDIIQYSVHYGEAIHTAPITGKVALSGDITHNLTELWYTDRRGNEDRKDSLSSGAAEFLRDAITFGTLPNDSVEFNEEGSYIQRAGNLIFDEGQNFSFKKHVVVPNSSASSYRTAFAPGQTSKAHETAAQEGIGVMYVSDIKHADDHVMVGTQHSDRFHFTGLNQEVTSSGGSDKYYGNEASNVINVNGDDRVYANDGDDIITSNGGVNFIDAGDGNDKVKVQVSDEDGFSYVFLGDGADVLTLEVSKINDKYPSIVVADMALDDVLKINKQGDGDILARVEHGNVNLYYDDNRFATFHGHSFLGDDFHSLEGVTEFSLLNFESDLSRDFKTLQSSSVSAKLFDGDFLVDYASLLEDKRTLKRELKEIGSEFVDSDLVKEFSEWGFYHREDYGSMTALVTSANESFLDSLDGKSEDLSAFLVPDV